MVQLISNFKHASELHMSLKVTVLEICMQCTHTDCHDEQHASCNTQVYSDKQFKDGRVKKVTQTILTFI